MSPPLEPAALPLPAVYVRAIELCQQRALSAWMNRDVARRRALDIGCGTGAWSIALASHGWDVTAIAPDEQALARARRRADEHCTRCQFQLGDAINAHLEGEFDLVLSVGVLQHIADHDRCAQALTRLSNLLAVGGTLLLLETAPTRHESRCNSRSFRVRTFDWYRRALGDAGLRVVEVLGVDPVPLASWILRHYRQLPRLMGDIALGATSAMSLPLDWLLGPSFPQTSWHKLIVAGHAAQGTSA